MSTKQYILSDGQKVFATFLLTPAQAAEYKAKLRDTPTLYIRQDDGAVKIDPPGRIKRYDKKLHVWVHKNGFPIPTKGEKKCR